MAKIENMEDFKKITSSITSFSHAYLFSVNSLESALPYIKEFAKAIILQGIDESLLEYEDTSYKIDHDEFDDLYIVNPNTIGINTEEINKLLSYMETKSLRDNGKRVYIIYGFERLSRDVSNKILKFLEEPSDNIYAILLTENFEKILPTIVSRCQVINLFFNNDDYNSELVNMLISFFKRLFIEKKHLIAYEYDYFSNALADRNLFYQYFDILEHIISTSLNKKCNYLYDERYICDDLLNCSEGVIINILNITNRLKCLIKGNINLNLLLDRYIIEITEELSICKK